MTVSNYKIILLSRKRYNQHLLLSFFNHHVADALEMADFTSASAYANRTANTRAGASAEDQAAAGVDAAVIALKTFLLAQTSLEVMAPLGPSRFAWRKFWARISGNVSGEEDTC